MRMDTPTREVSLMVIFISLLIGDDDDLVFYVPKLSTLFKLYQDDKRVILKDCAMKRHAIMGLIPPQGRFEPRN